MPKLLIVDDDANVLMTTQALFEDAGFTVLTRNAAIGTSQVVLQHRPDAVLLDVEMPGLGGRELARLLLDLPRMRVALFLFSGMDRPELERTAAELGALGALHKSMSPRLMVDEVRMMLEHWRRRSSATIDLRQSEPPSARRKA
ncbi:MAG: response regulator [Polyangiaceae bacterium]|nr:response regulator [Polyangiaceae bacterium]